MKEYSTELTKMLSELKDPDVKRPTFRRFNDLDQEEREIYMKASKKQPKPKVDIPPLIIPPPDTPTDGGQYENAAFNHSVAHWLYP